MASRPWPSTIPPTTAGRSVDGVENVEDVDEEEDGDGGGDNDEERGLSHS
jgi:hypothetical protein